MNYFRDLILNFSVRTTFIRTFNVDPGRLPPAHLQRAFQQVKQLLLTTLPITPVPPNQHLLLYSDFSFHGIGGVIAFEKNATIIVSRFVYRSLKPAEKNYATLEGEALAMLYILEQSKEEALRSQSVTVFTDNQPLLGSLKRFSLDSAFGVRLSRLLGKISAFSPTVTYLSGDKQFWPISLVASLVRRSDRVLRSPKNPVKMSKTIIPPLLRSLLQRLRRLELPRNVGTTWKLNIYSY